MTTKTLPENSLHAIATLLENHGFRLRTRHTMPINVLANQVCYLLIEVETSTGNTILECDQNVNGQLRQWRATVKSINVPMTDDDWIDVMCDEIE